MLVVYLLKCYQANYGSFDFIKKQKDGKRLYHL